MSLNTYSKSQRRKNQWTISALTLLAILLFIAQPGNTKEKKSNNNNRLPPAPDTGSPEEDFSAGGTRKKLENAVCSEQYHRASPTAESPSQVDGARKRSLHSLPELEQNLVYLLGNRNREFTSSAYPTFWFHIPATMNRITQMKFVVRELETGKKIYDRPIQGEKSGIIGITLPKEQKYALSPGVNYAWSLEVDCSQNQETEIALEGWVTRVSSHPKLQDRLAAASKTERHQVYLKHNLLYDALTELAQRRMAEVNNTQVATAWNQLLTELGWQDLVRQQSAIEPIILDIAVR